MSAINTSLPKFDGRAGSISLSQVKSKVVHLDK